VIAGDQERSRLIAKLDNTPIQLRPLAGQSMKSLLAIDAGWYDFTSHEKDIAKSVGCRINV
jgi:hypothetical protein